MQAIKSLYGTEILGLEDLIETKLNHIIELTYYKIKDTKENTNQYAVEIVKTEHIGEKIKVEKEKMNLLTDNETKTDEILDILKRNKVTPIGLEDTMIEISKMKIIRNEK